MTKVITINIQIRNSHQMSPGFKTLLEDRVSNHINLKEFVALLLEDQTQPLTVAEITILTNRELKRDYDKSTIRLLMYELLKENRVVSRTETPDERAFRANYKPVPGLLSAYYFSNAAGVKTPPARTVAIAVEGVDLSDAARVKKHMKKRGRPKGSKNRDKRVAQIAVPKAAASTVELLIEQLVAERTRHLQAELDDANAKLAQLKKLLAS